VLAIIPHGTKETKTLAGSNGNNGNNVGMIYTHQY